MKRYKVLLNKKTYNKAAAYLEELQAGKQAGRYLQEGLQQKNIAHLAVEEFIETLMRTKRPQIFAESAIAGDGRDWNQEELSILGDIGVAVPVTVYDNGRHNRPGVHDQPFSATLLFIPGALLRSVGRRTPADWNEATRQGAIDSEGYYGLYERRLLPLFLYANQRAGENGKKAFVTMPGLGCGQFAGKFRGQLGVELKQVLLRFLERHGPEFPHIQGVYYDPYREGDNERHEIHGISFLVRPLTKGNNQNPQLCRPQAYEEEGDHFAACELWSCVAWDHVSWPGNDFYAGSRATDDGVKAAATDSMTVMTGIAGAYDPHQHCYRPPAGYRNWKDVVVKHNVQLEVQQNLLVFPA